MRVPYKLFASIWVLALPLASCGRAARDAKENTKAAVGPNATAAAFYATKFERTPSVSELTELGRTLFFDPALSASGHMSCSSCHDPAHAWGPANSNPVQLGGADLKTPGLRAVPSLRYQQDTPAFSEHFSDDDADDGVDQGPAGGRDWDGRATSAHDQARAPLLSPFEMANADSSAVLAKLGQSASAATFRHAFGEGVFDTPSVAWNGLLMALEVFQQSPAEFYPYSSKYDAFLRSQTKLSAQEQRGLDLFEDRAKGNCAQCHPSEMRRGAFPQLTDRGFVALGVPRNARISANSDVRYFDLGLCGPVRRDLSLHLEYCGMFKTPTLRNVALRTVFFHNGAFNKLEDVIRFYQRRDVDPDLFYPHKAKFNDLPLAYRANISLDPPFNNDGGAKPRFTDAEAADIIAFLRTLTDGYVRR